MSRTNTHTLSTHTCTHTGNTHTHSTYTHTHTYYTHTHCQHTHTHTHTVNTPNRTGLLNVRHTFKYADPDVLGDADTPVLAINGDWDLFCPAAGGKKTAELFGGPKRAVTIGKAQGMCSHYGHFDVVVGRRAREEVWPLVLEHLEAHD